MVLRSADTDDGLADLLGKPPLPPYRIERKGFEDVEFTESSQVPLDLSAAVNFAAVHGAILQSAREAVAFYVEADGQEKANDSYATRTAVIFIKEGSRKYAVFDDIADKRKNIVLARSNEGYESYTTNYCWILPRTDKHVRAILKRANQSLRLVEVCDTTLEFSPFEVSRKSQSLKNRTLRAIIGNLSEPYAAFLQDKQRCIKVVALDRESPVPVPEDCVEVRTVNFVGSMFRSEIIINFANACCNSYALNYARGAIHR